LAPEPEQQARETIDKLLAQAGWLVCDASQVNIHAARGVAIREFPLPGHGFADYLLYIDSKAAGVIEAKKEGAMLTGVEIQAEVGEADRGEHPVNVRPAERARHGRRTLGFRAERDARAKKVILNGRIRLIKHSSIPICQAFS
jgi:hypothetical protein